MLKISLYYNGIAIQKQGMFAIVGAQSAEQVTVHTPLSQDIQREMMHIASFLCIAQRVAVNGMNSNRNNRLLFMKVVYLSLWISDKQEVYL